MKAVLQDMMDKYVDKVHEFKKHNCKDIVQIPEINGIRSLCNLFDTLATPENGVSILHWRICCVNEACWDQPG